MLLETYLEGEQFEFWTDHYALKCITNAGNEPRKGVWWLQHSSEFEFNVVQQASVEQEAADALPHFSTDMEDKIHLNNALRVLTIGPTKNAK